jgi:hypothetical protein
VAISGTEKPLSAGKSYTIECATGGSRPSANIHWYLHSIQQQAATERVRLSSIQFFLPFPGPSNFLIATATTEITRDHNFTCRSKSHKKMKRRDYIRPDLAIRIITISIHPNPHVTGMMKTFFSFLFLFPFR